MATLESSKANRAHKKAKVEQNRLAEEARGWKKVAEDRGRELGEMEDSDHELFGHLLEAEHAPEEEKKEKKELEELVVSCLS